MKKLISAALVLLMLGGHAQAQAIDARTQARIDRILKRTPLIDGHYGLPEQREEDYAIRIAGLANDTVNHRPEALMSLAILERAK